MGWRICPRSFLGRVILCVAIPVVVILINVIVNSHASTFASNKYTADLEALVHDNEVLRMKVEQLATQVSTISKTDAPVSDPEHLPNLPLSVEEKNASSDQKNEVASGSDFLEAPLRRDIPRSPTPVKKSDTLFVIEDGALSFQVELGDAVVTKGNISEIQHPGEDCWVAAHCNGAGACAWCGIGNACCRYHFESDPQECRTAEGFVSKKFHECVSITTKVYKSTHASLLVDGELVMRSQKSGLWSVGRNLRHDGWPVNWDAGGVDKVRINGPWLSVSGSVKTPRGHWLVKDRWRIYDGIVEGLRDWTYTSYDATRKGSVESVLSISWEAINGHGNGLFMPAVLYHGNPSGAKKIKNAPAVVHNWSSQPGFKLQVEEHRLAQTWVSFEWTNEKKQQQIVAALDSQPSAPPYARHADVHWSLGAEKTDTGTMLQLLSGSVAFNNQVGYVKSGQNQKTAFTNVGLMVPNGKRIQKRYRLHAGKPLVKGAGFRIPLHWTITRGDLSADGLPRFPDILNAKVRFALSRWCGENPYPGFAMYPKNRAVYVMGWAGQAEAPGYALPVLSERLGNPELRKIGYQALDVLSKAQFDKKGFKLKLDGKNGQWQQQDPVSQGQAMSAFARAIRYGRRIGHQSRDWDAFLTNACDIHSARILAARWRPRSTAEAFLIQPLALSSKLFNNAGYLQAAVKAGDHYIRRHVGLNEPFWGGTLDASAEDKEGAWAGFEAFLALYEITNETKWLAAAEYAADFTLTYTYMWDVNLPPGRLRDHDLKTRGWTAVSVQNMHLDVYGVLYTPRLWRLGQFANRPELFHLAELMYRSCGQMIDAHGSQGEQLQQTRFAQAGDMSDPERFRGGYVEGWTVFWIAAHFLTAAAQFEEMGVLSELWGRP